LGEKVDISIDPWSVVNTDWSNAIQHPETGDWMWPPCVPAHEVGPDWFGAWNHAAIWRAHWDASAPRLFNGAANPHGKTKSSIFKPRIYLTPPVSHPICHHAV